MTPLESFLVWTAIAVYFVGFLVFLAGLVFGKEKFPRWAYRLAVLGFISHTAAIGVRWEATGHFPVMATYENSLSGVWLMMITYFGLRKWLPGVKPFGVAILPLAVLILGNGVQTGGVLQPLEPPYRSKWLYIHVISAMVSFGAYVSAFAAGVMYLIKDRAKMGENAEEESAEEEETASRLPSLKILDELSLRLIMFGFFAEAIMIGSGAIWAHGLWGRYWAWDPVESWSLISWLTYGLNLHLRITLGWRGRRAAWLAIVSLFGVIFLFFGVGYVSAVHTMIF